ncbi:MAG: ABC transporter permease, partial [bacterium]|nr:ABC transporter permease [Candidatus Kapabacteria bacterium]
MSYARAFRVAIRQLSVRRATMLWSLTGVVVCGAIFAVVVAVTYGQDRYLRQRLSETTPHVTLNSERRDPLPQRLFHLDNGIVELVVHSAPTDRREIKPRVEVATRARRSSALITEIAPIVYLKGVYRNAAKVSAVDVRGVDPRVEKRIGRRALRMSAGTFDRLANDTNATIIGSGLAQRLAVRLDDDVTLITAGGVIRSFTIAGIFETDVIAVDDARAYVNLEVAQSLRGMARNTVNAMAVRVSDPDRIDRAARAAERATGFRAATWEDANASILDRHRIRMHVMWLVAGLFVIVAGFGVANALLASAIVGSVGNESLDDGMSARETARGVVLLQGIVLGTLGGFLAAALGFIVAA